MIKTIKIKNGQEYFDHIAKKNGYLLLRLHGNMTDNEIVERVGKCL